eukprot:TRINITY_DN1909_c1_g1_i1.p1 TRINITY_DN1909_c1_g1~~TRINITY_DN1909_c1_g1_i1.p1  ORF type:complete len:114 (-),score=13.61 TRINITY_DN1909_c1_g1_i1:173-514(-)
MSKSALLNILFIAIALLLCYYIWAQEPQMAKLQDNIALLEKNIRQFEYQILDCEYEMNLLEKQKAEKKMTEQESMSVFTALWRGLSERFVEKYMDPTARSPPMVQKTATSGKN